MSLMGYCKNALMTCWRVFLLLMLCLIVGLLLLYLFFPDLKRLQPELEMLVQQELHVSSVSVGALSWRWGWNVGIVAKHCSFSRNDLGLSLQDSRLSVRLSLTDLLQGNLEPTSISIKGGDANIDVSQGADLAVPVWTPIRFELDDVHVHWKWQKESASLHVESLKLLPSLQEIRLKTSSFQAKLHYDKELQADSVHVIFQNLDGLPQSWKSWMHGHLSGQVDAFRQADQQQQQLWQGSWQLKSDGFAAWQLKNGVIQLPFDAIEAKFSCQLSAKGLPMAWKIQDMAWTQDNNRATVQISWQQQMLNLNIQAPEVAMPLLWSWLKPLHDDLAWRQWLSSMHAGKAKSMSVSLTLPWQHFPQAPDAKAWKGLHYQVQGDVDDVDVSLGGKGVLEHTYGHVELNEHGMHSKISQTQLPDATGQVQGMLSMPWDTAVMDVKGQGKVDVQRLQSWLMPQSSNKTPQTFAWLGAAPAKADFTFQWVTKTDNFTAISVHVQPLQAWHIGLYKHPFWLDSGDLTWDMTLGLTAQHLQAHDADLNATGSFKLQKTVDKPDRWSLISFQGHMQGDLKTWVTRYHLPVESPQGNWQASVAFDGHQWMGDVDLKAASWKNLFGASKASNQAWKLNYQALLSKQALKLTHISSHQAPLQLDAYGEISPNHIVLNFSKLKTDAMDASVNMDLPLHKGVWRVNMKAAYLNQKALPKPLFSQSTDKPMYSQRHAWHVSADIKQFEWHDMELQGVHLDMTSKQRVASELQVSHVRYKTLSLEKVEAHFNVPQAGKIDIHLLKAQMLQNNLTVSALLTPQPSGGIKWQGFVILDGSLGGLMQEAKLSTLLRGGKLHAVFLGEGVFRRDASWCQDLHGQLRAHSKDGEILKGGNVTKLLALLSWSDLPKFLVARRPDITREGLVYEHLQMEATLQGCAMHMQHLAMRSSAVELAGQGLLKLDSAYVDMMLVAHPFQNLDAVITSIPLLGYVLGGKGHSIFRRAYHVYGPVGDAQVDDVSPKDAGAASSGLMDRFLNLPDAWFGDRKTVP